MVKVVWRWRVRYVVEIVWRWKIRVEDEVVWRWRVRIVIEVVWTWESQREAPEKNQTKIEKYGLSLLDDGIQM